MTSAPALDDDYVSPTSLPGAVIDEKYRVDGVIGRGGVGLVVAATHLAISQRVAIKMIRDDVPMQRELLDRFHREARAAAMIKSEFVARVLDVGRLPTGRPYIVMEYLEGEDLEAVLARGALPFSFAVDLTLQACEALAEAHRAGIIHRDLKPANLFLTRAPDGAAQIKVLDFGISKIQPLTADRGVRGVETTSIMGSPGYMAPEQMKSTRDVDARADVWSLGAVLYEMLVGSPAFAGSNMLEILDAIAACNPVPPSLGQPGVPASLDVVVGRCLTREPEQRYATIADLAVALQPFSSPAGAGLAERAVRISREPVPAFDESQFTALRSEPRPSSVTVVTPGRRATPRRRLVTAAIVGGVVPLLVLALFLLLRSTAGVAAPAASVAAPTVPSAPVAVSPPPVTTPAPASWQPVGSASAVVSTPAAPTSLAPSARVASAPASPRPAPARLAPRPAPQAAPPAAPQDSPFGDRK